MKRSEVYVTVGLQKEAKEQEMMEIRNVNFLIFLLTTNFRKIPFGTEHRIQNKRVWWRTKVTIKECYFVFFLARCSLMLCIRCVRLFRRIIVICISFRSRERMNNRFDFLVED